MNTGIRHILAAATLTPTVAILALTAAMFVPGCTAPNLSLAVDTDPAAWNETAVVSVENTDTMTLRDMNLFLNCNNHFQEDTLTVRIGIQTPGRGAFEEPFLLVIPHAATPAAAMREAFVPYRHRVRFPLRGIYRVSITPCRPVRGVEAAGIYIVKSN